MKKLKLLLSLLFVFTLAGCIGEKYDFSPPTIGLLNPNDITQTVTSAESNIKWSSDEQYNLETKDIEALAEKQEPFTLNVGQLVDYTFEDGYFNEDGVSVKILRNGEEQSLIIDGIQSFRVPDEPGEYTLIFDLKTDKGNAKYVGKIIVR